VLLHKLLYLILSLLLYHKNSTPPAPPLARARGGAHPPAPPSKSIPVQDRTVHGLNGQQDGRRDDFDVLK
jgi:hypothetical protein